MGPFTLNELASRWLFAVNYGHALETPSTAYYMHTRRQHTSRDSGGSNCALDMTYAIATLQTGIFT